MRREDGQDWSTQPDAEDSTFVGNSDDRNAGWFSSEFLIDAHDYDSLRILCSMAVLSAVVLSVLSCKLWRYVKDRSTYRKDIYEALRRAAMYRPLLDDNKKRD